jgi:hypothetical protein
MTPGGFSNRPGMPVKRSTRPSSWSSSSACVGAKSSVWPWDQVDLVDAELYVGEQLQRVRGKLVRREVKTETSEAPLPLPDLCVTALKFRKTQQDADRYRAGDGWIDTGLVFTTRHGTTIEPRNFGRSFDRCIIAARVPGSPSTALARPVLRCWPA